MRKQQEDKTEEISSQWKNRRNWKRWHQWKELEREAALFKLREAKKERGEKKIMNTYGKWKS